GRVRRRAHGLPVLRQRLHVRTGQGLVLVPPVLRDVVASVRGLVRGGVVPRDGQLLTDLHLVLLPPVRGLLVQVHGVRTTHRAQLAVCRTTGGRVQGESLRGLQRLRLPLD